MIQFIPIKKRTKQHIDTDNTIYIENTKELNSIAKKYNYAIEKYCLNSNEKCFCFRHEDITFLTPMDVIDYKLNNMFSNPKIGVAGLIGTYLLETSCIWWNPGRAVNGAGSIVQVNAKGEEYEMRDWPGEHHGLATVDGCCLFLSKTFIDSGARFDEDLHEYHFYDVDICCQALEKQFDVSTIDIKAKHESEGHLPENFEQLKLIFFSKWQKRVERWPIGKYSKFKT